MSEITAHHGLFRSTKLHVDDTGGSGRPVVLIHGWPLSGESWSGQVPALQEAGYRVITYDRRGFGRSEKPRHGYDYDTLTDDLHDLLKELDLRDVTLVGFSMGGGEVARWFTRHRDDDRVRSVVFASAVPPYLTKSFDNPDGPLTPEAAKQMEDSLKSDRDAFFPQFVHDFYSANGELKATEEQVQEAVAMAQQSSQDAAVACMESFATTNFRTDLPFVSVPTLVIHGDADGVVPYAGSGKLTHEEIVGSELHVVHGGPHGINVTHQDEFNEALLAFLAK